MTDAKKITVSAQVELQTKQVDAAIKKLADQFKSIDKNSFNKMNEDFRKLSPLIKNLDKDLAGMMGKISKKDARDQLNLMNKALSDQTKILRDNISEYDKLTEEIENATDAAKKLALESKRSQTVEDRRATMGSMEQHAQRRDEAKQALGQGGISPSKAMGAAMGVEIASKIAQSLVTHFSGRDARKQGYEAQTADYSNSLASLATSGSLAYGTAKSNGRLDSGIAAADKMTSGQLSNRWIQGAGDMLAGGAAGLVAGPAGGLAGLAAGGGKALSDNADAIDPETNKAWTDAQYANNRQAALHNSLAPNAFKVGLQDNLVGKASGRLSTMEAFSGYGNSGSAQLNKDLWQGSSRGFGQSETMGMAAGLGQAGFIGSERTNLSPVMQMQRQGLASSGESTGMASAMGGVLSNQKNVMKTFQKSMEDGVKTGIEKSLVKDLTMAATSIAGMGASRVSDMNDVMTQMRGILSGKNPSEIGKSTIADAQSVAQAQQHLMQGGGSARGEAIQYDRKLQGASAAGFDMDKLDIGSRMLLGQATSRQDIMGNDALMEQLGGADKDGTALGKFLGTGKQDNVKRMSQMGMLQMLAPISGTAKRLSTDEGFTNFQKGFAKDATSEQHAAAMKDFNSLARTGQAAGVEGFGTAQQAQMSMQSLTGQELTGDQKKTIVDSDKSAEGGMARFSSTLENLKDKLALSGGGFDQMKQAMDRTIKDLNTLADAANGTQTPMDKLDQSMLALMLAVRENTNALTGKKDDKELSLLQQTLSGDSSIFTKKGWQEMLFGKHESLNQPNDTGSSKGPGYKFHNTVLTKK